MNETMSFQFMRSFEGFFAHIAREFLFSVYRVHMIGKTTTTNECSSAELTPEKNKNKAGLADDVEFEFYGGRKSLLVWFLSCMRS